MLRRRILASAMASVMALGSVAVVANAEETAVKAVKTKADLEAYIASFEDFRSNELYDYGSISGENFLSALEYADNVLADDKANVDDYTAAYAMVEAVYNRLVIYTADELKALVDSCTSIIETNNIYNEELGDAIYTSNSFSDFEGAYYEAESVLDSADSRIITDAYENLAAKKSGLSPLAVVSKSQFRTALKAYESSLQAEYKYDTWRVGTVEGSDHWGYNGQVMAFGTLYEHIASIEELVSDAYAELDEVKGLSKTSQENIVNAYKACVAAANILDHFVPDDTNRANKAAVKSLLNEYHGRLVYDYNTTSAEELYEAIVEHIGTVADATVETVDANDGIWNVSTGTFTVNPNGDRGYSVGDVDKTLSAAVKVKASVAYYIGLDKNGVWNGKISDSKETVKVNADDKYKLVSAKSTIDLTQFVEVTADMIKVDATDEDTKKQTAVDNHLVNNTVDGDSDPEVKEFDADSLADYTVSGINSWEYQPVVDALTYAGFYDKATDSLNADGSAFFAKQYEALKAVDADEKMTKAEKAAAKDKIIGEIYNKVEDGSYKYAWAVKDKFLPYYIDKTETPIQVSYALTHQIGKWNDNVKAIADGGYDIGFDQTMDGTYNGFNTFATLDTAMELAEFYLNTTDKAILKDEDKNGIYDIDSTDSIADDSAKGSSAEWALVYRYLKYALSDKYDAVAAASHTKAEVEDLIDKCYELAELTGDAALFAVNHNRLVDARQTALDWVKLANKDKKYKDNTTPYAGKVATGVYNDLWAIYEQLEKDYKAFKYSYEDIYLQIAETKAMIDDGDLEDTADLLAALEETAYTLSTVKILCDANGDEVADNEAFTSDRYFQGFNRVFTNGDEYELATGIDEKTGAVTKTKMAKSKDGGANASHLALQTAYEKLLAAIKAQTEVTVLKGDVDGNGTVNALDASALLVNVVNGVTMDAAVADYDANGAINALDAAAILTAIVNA